MDNLLFQNYTRVETVLSILIRIIWIFTFYSTISKRFYIDSEYLRQGLTNNGTVRAQSLSLRFLTTLCKSIWGSTAICLPKDPSFHLFSFFSSSNIKFWHSQGFFIGPISLCLSLNESKRSSAKKDPDDYGQIFYYLHNYSMKNIYCKFQMLYRVGLKERTP